MENPVTQKTVTVPIRLKSGIASIDVTLNWICPTCREPRGDIFDNSIPYADKEIMADGWRNPCEHGESYADVVKEAFENGLNPQLGRFKNENRN